jgi:L-asparaginase II
MSKPKISIGALGGTICMSAGGKKGGVKPSFSADDLIAAVPVLKDMAKIHAQTILALPSGSLKLNDIISVYKWAKEQIKNGAKGVVITQGTDTLEESSFFLNLIWDEEAPLVMTGAMRNADDISADGAGNIYASVITALDDKSRNRGVLVVLNDTIHSAKWVHKSNTFSLQTFISVNAGVQGMVVEREARYITCAVKRKIYPLPDKSLPKIAIVQSYLDNDGSIIKLIGESKFEGMVIDGFGAGHVSFDMMDEIEKLKIPVIVSSKTGSGMCATKTYGYKGSEIDLQNNKCIMSGWLPAVKARLLLIILLANKISLKEIKNEFENF